LQFKTKWPRHAFYWEADRLGVRTHGRRRRWTPEDVQYLEESVGSISLTGMAKRLGRTPGSVRAKIEALQLSRRVREGYTLSDLCLVFGVPADKGRAWLRRGLLGTVHANGSLRVKAQAVDRFIREYPGEYDLRRVDQMWFKGMVFGRQAGS